jgi:hypothetical protein
MGERMKEVRKELTDSLDTVEQIADEIRVKLHLGNMDAKWTWHHTLEPKLLEAREHAQQASEASAKAIDDVAKAFRDFAATL